MSLLLLVAVALAGGLATSLLAPSRPRLSVAVGLVAALVTMAAAMQVHGEDALPIGGTVVVASDALRTVGVAWSIAAFLLGAVDALTISSTVVLGPALLGLGIAVLALAVPEPATGFAALAASAAASVIVPSLRLRPTPHPETTSGAHGLRMVVVASLLAIGAVAWGASPAGPLAAAPGLGDVDPAAEASIGLGLLAIVGAVILRTGALPAHVWAARFVEAVPATAVPAALGWGAAAFSLVALAWADATIGSGVVGAQVTAERAIVAILAAGSVLLGGAAAWLHEDIEHVLWYSIVADAGVVLLAFVSLSPDQAPRARDWVIAAAAVKSALAGWVAATRATYGVHRLPELSGWAVRSPILGVAFGVIAIAAIGLPGMAAFEARGALVSAALPGPFDAIVTIGAFAPIVYLGRLLLVGIGRPSAAVAAAPRGVIRWHGGRTPGWAGGSLAGAVRAVPAEVRANRLPLAAAAVLGLAILGLAVASIGVSSDTGAASASGRTAIAAAGVQSAGASAQRSMSRS